MSDGTLVLMIFSAKGKRRTGNSAEGELSRPGTDSHDKVLSFCTSGAGMQGLFDHFFFFRT